MALADACRLAAFACFAAFISLFVSCLLSLSSLNSLLLSLHVLSVSVHWPLKSSLCGDVSTYSLLFLMHPFHSISFQFDFLECHNPVTFDAVHFNFI